MNNVTIRNIASPQDFTAIAALWVALGWGKTGEEAIVQRALEASAWIAIAEFDGQFAGYGRAFSDGVIATYLTEIAVVPVLRRRGVATALIQDCLECCKQTSVYADAVPEILPLLERLDLQPRPRYLTACSRAPVSSIP